MRTIGNLLWLVLSGIEMAIADLIAGLISIVFIVTIPLHVVFGLLLAITVIGIPFTVVHFKLAGVALTPYGKDVVDARFAHGEDMVVAAPTPLGSA